MNATLSISPDAKSYEAEIVLNDTSEYELFEYGMLGEKIPLSPRNLTLFWDGKEIEAENERGKLTFPKGDYLLKYDDSLSGNNLIAQFSNPSNVTVLLPSPYLVGNPLLTSIQPTKNTVEHEDNMTKICWNGVREIEVRFYDETQEHFLFIFAQFWLIIAVVMLLPFIMGRQE